MAGFIKKEDIIDDVQIQKAFEQIGRAVSGVMDNLDKLAQTAAKANKELSGSGSLGDLLNETKKASKSVEELTFNESELAKQAQELGKLTAKLEEIESHYNKEIVKTKEAIKQKNAEIKEEITGEKASQKAKKENTEEQKRLNKEIKEYEKFLKEARRASIKAAFEEHAEAVKAVKLTAEQVKWQKLKTQQNESEAGSYNQVNAQYQRVVILLNKMSGEYRENNERGKALTKTANELYAQLSKLDQATGRHQRSVGNYSKAFNGLQFQMQQIAREAPSLAYGPQMFIAAISNNLPMLQDEIGKVRRENELLRAEGKKGVPVWKQMAAGLLSWQTAAVTLVTAYMLFSKEINAWIAGIFKGREAIDVLKKSQEEYNKAVVEGIGNAQKDVTTLNLLYNAARDVNKSMEERNIAVQKLQEMYPKYFGNMDAEIIKAGDAGKAYEVLKNRIIEASKARAFSDQIAENTKKMEVDLQPQIDKKLQELDTTKKELDRLKTSYDQASRIDPETAPAVMMALAKKEEQYKRLGGEVQALAEEYDVLDEANKRLEKGINISSLYDEPIAKGTTRGLGGNKYTELEQMQNTHKLQLAETEAYQQKLKGLQEVNDDELKRIDQENAKELLIQRLAQIDEEKKIKGLSNEQLANLDIEYAEKNKELQKTMTDNAIDEAKRMFKQREDEAKRISEITVDDTATRMVQGEIALNEQARLNIEKIRNEKDAADKIRDIQLQLSLDILEMRKKEYEAALNSGKLTVEDAQRIKEQLQNIEVQISEGKLKISADTTKGIVKDDKQRLRDLGDAVNAGADFILTGYDRQLAKAQETYDKEIQAAGDNVEAKILAERKFEEEQKKIRRKQDLAERAQTLFNLGLMLAEAIAEVNPFKIAAATFGIATTLAKPMPQYAKGTRSHTGGAAIMGEEGTELVTEPDGRMWLTDSKPMVYDLARGASVLPADKTAQFLQNYSVTNGASVFLDMTSTNNHLSDMKHILKNKEERQYDLSGRLTEKKRGNITIHYIR